MNQTLFTGITIVSLSLSALSGVAQTAIPTPVIGAIVTQLQMAQADTVLAIRRLFQEQRQHSRLGGVIGLGFTALWFPVMLKTESTLPSLATTAVTSAGGGFAGASIYNLIQFSRKREQKLLLNWQTGQPLPALIRSQLTAKYFTPE
ncbi:hypothetical protein H8B13_01230 [Hymenobacter sp. BT188]|uniref:hypothetical protein n=1 Tax=Hymenobacter sp. BT188 TaxID=2763504 RepID=UPI001651448D|nr:hypothetical protein [Hymenobacter sp. BT188]MBC6605431.1 hypothetical protein [Hymenobacter sp. BT188]